MTTEEIIAKLRFPGNKVPQAELEEVVRRREEFVPLLIEEIETATRLGAEADLDDCLASFALHLLAELREPRALQPILDFFALDEATETDLFGDIITEHGPQILAAIGHDNPEALQTYAQREGISQWVRGATFNALVVQALWGEQPRENVVRFFAELIAKNQFGTDVDAWTALVNACADFHCHELLSGIKGLYQCGLIDPMEVGSYEAVRHEIENPLEVHPSQREHRSRPIAKTAEVVRWWQMFAVERTSPRNALAERLAPEAPAALPKNNKAAPPVTPAPVIGRNDLCPCGSGKKYKKCCLGS